MLLLNTPRTLYLLSGRQLSRIPAGDTGSFLCARWTLGNHLFLLLVLLPLPAFRGYAGVITAWQQKPNECQC